MDFKLEVIVLPVSDIDRAVTFYRDRCGFAVDVDAPFGEGGRLVQLTPPGSGCSVIVGSGIIDSPPGSVKGLQLVVDDIEAARAELVGRGLDVTEVRHVDERGQWVPGKGGDWNSFVMFSDPDGNAWAVQERPSGR
jgi:catechol 2,3-dioxygenase-like lactoylglutathione lyase family enzyme